MGAGFSERDLGRVPGLPEVRLLLVGRPLKDGTREMTLTMRNVQSRDVCKAVEGRIVMDPIPGTDGLSDAERLALSVLPHSAALRSDFPSLLRDPFWQAAIDVLLVEHVMES